MSTKNDSTNIVNTNESPSSEPNCSGQNKWSGWLIRSTLPALIIALGTSLGGYFFSDSLQARTQAEITKERERSRAEIRNEVLTHYLAVDNTISGKRSQILLFAEVVLAEDDPKLKEWINKEKEVVITAQKRNEDMLEDINMMLDNLQLLDLTEVNASELIQMKFTTLRSLDLSKNAIESIEALKTTVEEEPS